MMGLVPGRSSASVEALCRVSVRSQTSSTGLPHVETLTSPPTTKKKKDLAGTDREEGVKGGEKTVCLCGRFEREKNLFPRKYRLSAAKIKARSEPKTHLKNLSAVSPSSLVSVTHFCPPPLPPPPLPPFFVALSSAIQQFCAHPPAKKTDRTRFSERMVPAREQRADSLAPFPSVLRSLPFTLLYLF